jgi:hypothetical protein
MSSPPTSMYSSNETDDFVGTSAIELSRMLTDPISDERLQTAFEGQRTAYAILRQYHFVTMGLNHILYNLNRHQTERNTLYHALMTSVRFQETLEPILMDFHRRQQMNDPSPLVVPSLLPPSSPTDSPQSVPINSPPQMTTSIDDPPTSTSSIQSNESFLSYYTADREEPGTPTHPIDVDQLPDQQVTTNYKEMGTQTNPIDVDQFTEQHNIPYPRTNNVRKIHSAPALGYCTICDRTGHLTEHCLRRVEPYVSTVKRLDIIKLNVQNFIETYCDSIQDSNGVSFATNRDTPLNSTINCRFHSNPSHLVNYPHSSPKTFTTPKLLTSNLEI